MGKDEIDKTLFGEEWKELGKAKRVEKVWKELRKD